MNHDDTTNNSEIDYTILPDQGVVTTECLPNETHDVEQGRQVETPPPSEKRPLGANTSPCTRLLYCIGWVCVIGPACCLLMLLGSLFMLLTFVPMLLLFFLEWILLGTCVKTLECWLGNAALAPELVLALVDYYNACILQN